MSLLSDKHRRGQAPTIVSLQVPTNGGAARVYVFEADDKKMGACKEVFYCLCTMFATFSFGIMLGWPSPTYPDLLDPIYTKYPFDPVGNFTIPSDPGAPLRGPFMITLIQSPLIAGLLMLGVVLATPFSSQAYTMGSIKHGLLVSLLAMFLGWVILWQSSNIFHLLVSRFLIGLGNGYAIGQVKVYIQHSNLTPQWRILMAKMINIVMLLGVTCAFAMGIWLDFKGFAIGAIAITGLLFALTHFLSFGESTDSKVPFVGGPGDQDASRAKEEIWSMLRTKRLRTSNWCLVTLTFVQQFSGAPATIVYTQVLLLDMGLPPLAVPYCALIYLIVYILAYTVGLFYFCTFSYAKKRVILLISMILSILALILIIVIIYLDLRDTHVYIPLLGMCSYIFVYGLGLGTIPNTIAEHLYDAQWRRCAGELQLMCFSLFAVIITKLLQVFLGEFPLQYVFVLHVCVAAAGLPFVLFVLPRKPPH